MAHDKVCGPYTILGLLKDQMNHKLGAMCHILSESYLIWDHNRVGYRAPNLYDSYGP